MAITTNNEIFNGLCRSLLSENEFDLMMIDKVCSITTDLSYMKQWNDIIEMRKKEIQQIERWMMLSKLANELKVEFKEV